MTLPADPAAPIDFGRFTIHPHRRELVADGALIELGARAFDLLMALIDGRGHTLGKDELMTRAWPGRIVDENSLQVQISALRKAFAADRDLIRTIAGRGYLFAGEIRPSAVGPAALHSETNLPEPVSELICRETSIDEVTGLVASHRLVTLIGTGGIGKTRLAIEVARQMVSRFPDGVWIAELGHLSSPNLVAATVAMALRMPLIGGDASSERIAKALGHKKLMLVLDNCEHLVDASTRLVEALLRLCPSVNLLVTSREPLRAEGECTYQVPPLGVPSEGTLDVEELLQAGAVKLFLERARSAIQHFSPDRRVIKSIVSICRRLDGIPLSIELAAAGVATLGIEEVASRLHDRFALLTGGRRTALPRHQTLRATLDWSYDLLPKNERLVLHRLAVFAGGFTLDAASAVVADTTECSEGAAVTCIVNLIAKSLVSPEVAIGAQHYRLLETTRAYALEKLTDSGELDQFARRHAQHYLDIFKRAEIEWETQLTKEWLSTHGRQISNVRAALDWSFSEKGDAAIGVSLTAASVPLWFQLSLVSECLARIKQALACIECGTVLNERRQMQLFAALAGALMYTTGPGAETQAAWRKVREIAERLGDVDYQLRMLWGTYLASVCSGEYRNALGFAQRFYTVAASAMDRTDILVGERMMGAALHILGDQINARRHIEQVLSRYVAPVRRSHSFRFQYDQLVTARAFHARILWLQGYPDQAMRAAQRSVEDARTLDHVLTLCNALTHAGCPISILNGDIGAATKAVNMLLEYSVKYGVTIPHVWGIALQGTLILRCGDPETASVHLRAALDELRGINFTIYNAALFGNLAESLVGAGQTAEALITIDDALVQSEREEERWCIAELLRIKGEIILLGNSSIGLDGAENLFLQSLDWARRQGARSWELRTSMSLARLLQRQGRISDARTLLDNVYSQFTEGFGTADLIEAKTLLDAFRPRRRSRRQLQPDDPRQ